VVKVALDGSVTTFTNHRISVKKGKEGRRKDHGGNNEGDYTIHQSSSSHADHTDKVTDLCNLVSGQDTFTGGEVVFESDRRVSAVW
jgi:hypothetical protein